MALASSATFPADVGEGCLVGRGRFGVQGPVGVRCPGVSGLEGAGRSGEGGAS